MAVHNSTSIQTQTPQAEFLSGWKDIASYLGKGIRTVQRYERELRLPVRRPGRARGSVIAFRIDLEQWVSASPMKSSNNPQLKLPILDPQNGVFELRRHRAELSSGILELRRRCTEGHGLNQAIRSQCAALQSCIERVALKLSATGRLRKTETHLAIAAEQMEQAREMITSARRMSDRAIEMRCQSRPALILNY